MTLTNSVRHSGVDETNPSNLTFSDTITHSGHYITTLTLHNQLSSSTNEWAYFQCCNSRIYFPLCCDCWARRAWWRQSKIKNLQTFPSTWNHCLIPDPNDPIFTSNVTKLNSPLGPPNIQSQNFCTFFHASAPHGWKCRFTFSLIRSPIKKKAALTPDSTERRSSSCRFWLFLPQIPNFTSHYFGYGYVLSHL